MEERLNVNDLVVIIRQYREELSNVTEQKMMFKALLEQQKQRNKELEMRIDELQHKEQDERANE